MAGKIGRSYDFLTWTSPPSCLRVETPITEPAARYYYRVAEGIPVRSNSTLKVSIKIKLHNVTETPSTLAIYGYSEAERRWKPESFLYIVTPKGTIDWSEYSAEEKVPSDITYIRVVIGGGKGDPTGVTWFDDLRIYQDDVLIYANDFSNWNPYIGAGALGIATGIGAHQLTKNVPIAVGAGVAGALVGATIGYLISST